MKKLLVVTVVSFIVVGILGFIGLNFISWLTKELEVGNRPHYTPPPQQSVLLPSNMPRLEMQV
jgi:hypothetical protein